MIATIVRPEIEGTGYKKVLEMEPGVKEYLRTVSTAKVQDCVTDNT